MNIDELTTAIQSLENCPKLTEEMKEMLAHLLIERGREWHRLKSDASAIDDLQKAYALAPHLLKDINIEKQHT